MCCCCSALRRRYGAEKQRFKQIVFLNAAQALVCLVCAFVWLAVARPKPKGGARARHFWLPALSNTIGPALGVEALKNIR